MARSRTLVNPENPNGIQVPLTTEEEDLADSEEAQSVIDKKEFEALAWKRSRKAEYPPIGDQLDMIYKDMKNGTSTHADAVEAVKSKYPKE